MKRSRKNPQAEWMKTVDQIAQDAAQMSSTFSICKQDPASSPELLDYAWGKEARAALKIEDLKTAFFPDANGNFVQHELPADYVNKSNRDLRRTFERFKLDPADPWSWRMVAEYMSMIVSLPQRKRGRPVVYTPEKLMQIRQDRESGALKNLTDSKAAKPLAKKYASSTRKSGAEGMRKQIRKARTIGTE
jgi:hypothetical protein